MHNRSQEGTGTSLTQEAMAQTIADLQAQLVAVWEAETQRTQADVVSNASLQGCWRCGSYKVFVASIQGLSCGLMRCKDTVRDL